MEDKKDKQRIEVLRKASSDPTTIAYAQACVDAMNIREDSYNHEAVKLEVETQRRRKGDDGSFYGFVTNYASFYEKGMLKSCVEACKKNNLSGELAYPILLSFHWSNDLLDWAKEMLGK